MKIHFKKHITGLLLLILVISSVACKRILDLEPHNSTFTGAYFTNGQDANSAISGAYSSLRRVLLNNYSWHVYGDAPSGEFSIRSDRDNQNYNISNGEFTGLNVGSGNWNWQSYYQLLQQVNLIINKVPGIAIEKFTNQDDKKRIIGEAYFLRAFTYFYMSRIWGDVPLRLEPDLDINQAKNIPRTPAAEVLAQCIKDLELAKANLVFGYSDENQRAVRANKGSALALEAHIKAWTGDYAGSEIASDDVIKNGGYALSDSTNYSKVFIGKSLEGIFEINISYGQSEGISLNGGGYAPTLRRPYVANKADIQWPVNTSYINKIYKDTTDIRYRTFFFQAQSSEGQTIKFSNVTYADGSAKNDPRLSNNLIIFRLADIYLLRAEALNKLGRDGEAVILLNAIRKRAKVAEYVGGGTALGTTILEERLRELYFEGQSYYDMVRTKTLPTYNERFKDQFMNGTPEGGWLWPIDPGMFKDDFTLTQTPYWQGRL
ncbi:RagB/SusD family nutrient uptake outer membrane protein [Pedobacter panaciterrae]